MCLDDVTYCLCRVRVSLESKLLDKSTASCANSAAHDVICLTEETRALGYGAATYMKKTFNTFRNE